MRRKGTVERLVLIAGDPEKEVWKRLSAAWTARTLMTTHSQVKGPRVIDGVPREDLRHEAEDIAERLLARDGR